MSDEQYSLRELAALAQVTPRTVRYYTAEGLLPPPDTRGRYARYGAQHLRRLRQIARLKADYLPLQVIRERLEALGDAATAPAESRRASPAAPDQAWRGRSLPTLAEGPASYSAGGAAAGPRMQAETSGGDPSLAGDPFRLAPQPQVGRVEFFPADGPSQEEELIARLTAVAREGDAGAPPATTEVWRCLLVAPGVEVRLREPIAERRRRRIEALVAALRDELLREEGA